MTEITDNKEPGISLARARQEKNLTLDEVAARLHLSANQIRMLEENDYEDLPEATYIKGYLRNYAQLLGLDPLVLIAAFTERAYPKKNDTVDLTPTTNKNTSVGDNSKAMYSIAGIVVLVVIVIGIWMGSQNKVDSTTAEQVESKSSVEEQSDSLFGPGMNDQPVDESVAGLANEDVQVQTPQQESQEPEYPASPNTVPANANKVPDSAPEKEQPDQTRESTKQTTSSSSVTTEQETIESNVQETEKVEQIDELVLFFEQNSWADVRDVNEKKLLYKTINEGRVVSVKGVAPFKVFLGNADGVKLSFNGKQIDFEKYKRGLIARFTVGRK